MHDFSWSNDAIQTDIVNKHLKQKGKNYNEQNKEHGKYNNAKADLETKRIKGCSVAFCSFTTWLKAEEQVPAEK